MTRSLPLILLAALLASSPALASEKKKKAEAAKKAETGAGCKAPAVGRCAHAALRAGRAKRPLAAEASSSARCAIRSLRANAASSRGNTEHLGFTHHDGAGAAVSGNEDLFPPLFGVTQDLEERVLGVRCGHRLHVAIIVAICPPRRPGYISLLSRARISGLVVSSRPGRVTRRPGNRRETTRRTPAPRRGESPGTRRSGVQRSTGRRSP